MAGFALALFAAIAVQINRKAKVVMAKLSELATILKNFGDQLEKALTELKNTDPDISPEGQAQLDRIAAAAKALDDITPDQPA